MILIKIALLFVAIFSLIMLIEQNYLIHIALKNKVQVKDNGSSRVLMCVFFSVCTALLVVFWDKF